MRLVILFDVLLNPSFKMTTSFASIDRSTASRSKFNIKFTIDKQINHSIAFLDIFISGINNQNITLQTFYKSTYTGLKLNFKSFGSFSYKISSIKCLINWLKDKSDVHYFKLPYIGNLSHHIKINLSKLCKEFCKENFNFKLVFNSFKVKNYFSYKDPIPNDLKSFLVYKFTCPGCSSSYIGGTCRHFRSRIEEHIKKYNKSHIFNW